MTEASYDSRPDTFAHSLRVGALMVDMLQEAMRRAVEHDLSKTREPEVATFDRCTSRLKAAEYGSPEYQGFLDDMKPALEHHYAQNRHHPQHFGARGVDGMTLVDLLEMLADWKASTERVANGDLRFSIEHNRGRFDLSEQLAAILANTAEHFGWVAPVAAVAEPAQEQG